MANINHSALTDPYIHEPKGIAAASANKVYVANGTGGGAWLAAHTVGWENVADNATSAQALTSGSFIDLTNDGVGSASNSTHRLPGTGAIWNASTNAFDFSDFNVGDTLDFRFNLTFVTSGANDVVAAAIDMAHGDAGEFSLEFFRQQFKSAGTYTVYASIHVYLASAATITNPGKVTAYSDSTSDTCAFNSVFVRVNPINPVYS